MKYKLFKSRIFIFCLLIISGCSRHMGGISENLSQQSESDFKEDKYQVCTFFSSSEQNFEKMWLEFSSKNEFEIASEKDFRFSSLLPQDRYTKSDIEMWVKCPIKTGDFNYDGIEDFVIMVIDNKISSDDKFSLIIFNILKDRKNKESAFLPIFVYQNKNLSNIFVSKSRAGLSILDYQEDGSFSQCQIKWDGKTQSYQCR